MLADKAKAIVAAVVSFGAVWVTKKFGIEIGPEMEAAIVGLIMGLVVYFVPNAKTAA